MDKLSGTVKEMLASEVARLDPKLTAGILVTFDTKGDPALRFVNTEIRHLSFVVSIIQRHIMDMFDELEKQGMRKMEMPIDKALAEGKKSGGVN